MSFPKNVRLMEVGPRDGLQNEAQWVSTQDKIKLIENLVSAGVKRIEVTAFVSPRWIPALADHKEVANAIIKRPDVSYAALVPNLIGYDNAKSCDINEVSLVISATNSHNLKNLNATTEEVYLRCQEVAKRALADNTPFRVYLSCTFGCPYEKTVPIENVLDLSKKLIDLGAYEIALSDTIGVANPKQVIIILEKILQIIPQEKIALHLHDTRGMALANIFAALSMGIYSFDSSAGGLGGCPYASGATGNVATEDLVNMLEEMGIKTGINLENLIKTSLQTEKILKKIMPSKLLAIKRMSNLRENQ